MLEIIIWSFVVVVIATAAFLITRNAQKKIALDVFNGAAMAVYRTVRRSIIFLVGGSVLVLGVVMLVTPGPAFVFIPLGLAILGTEFFWARHLLVRVKNYIMEMAKKAAGNDSNPSSGEVPPPAV